MTSLAYEHLTRGSDVILTLLEGSDAALSASAGGKYKAQPDNLQVALLLLKLMT